MKSIMHSKADRTCYLCMAFHGDYSQQTILEEHHVIYGNGRRKLSEAYGLKVYLCPAHHRSSPESVHDNKETRKYGDYLKVQAEIYFSHYFPGMDFKEIFGMHYAAKTQRAEPKAQNNAAGIPEGFIILEDKEDEEQISRFE